METETTANMAPVVGQAVLIVNEVYEERHALVTAVHGVGYQSGDEFIPPLINAVYVSSDSSKRDPYGQQLERLSSLNHEKNTKNMPKPGRFWRAL